MSEGKNTVVIKTYSKKEMREMYGISKWKFNNLIREFRAELGDTSSHYFTPKQVEVIFAKLNPPIQNREVNID